MGMKKPIKKADVGKRRSEASARKRSKTLADPSKEAKVRSEKKRGREEAKQSAEDAEKKKKRKAPAEDESAQKSRLPFKKRRRKEITSLYAELTNPGRDRKPAEIVKEILELQDSHATTMAEFCCSDIGSRVLQACLKWGSYEQRRSIFSGLGDSVCPTLCLDRYGAAVVPKLLLYCIRMASGRTPTEVEKKTISKNLSGFLAHFSGKGLHRTFYHRVGCRVINNIYFSEILGQKDRRRLLHSIAVPPMVTLARTELPGTRPLRQMLVAEDIPADQRKKMVDHLREAVEKSIDKELLCFDITHLLFQAYCEMADETELKDLAEKCMAGAPYLLSSKAGAEALVRLLGVANAKQRKALCKDLKGKFAALANNPVDYTVLIRMAATIDDTVLLGKSMLAELSGDLAGIMEDKYGKKVLLWLLKPGDPRHFDPYVLRCVGLPAPTALKAAETRTQELARALKPPLRAALLAAPIKSAADANAKDVFVGYLEAEWDTELVEALLAAAEREAKEDGLGLLGEGATTTALLALLRAEPASAEAAFAVPLWQRCLKPRLCDAAVSRCAFVLLELLKERYGDTAKAVADAVKKARSAIETAVVAADKAGGNVKGARNLIATACGGVAVRAEAENNPGRKKRR